MRGSPDEILREKLWKKENKIVVCYEHYKIWADKSYVLKIEKLDSLIECGFITCTEHGTVKLKLARNSMEKFKFLCGKKRKQTDKVFAI